MSVYKGDQVIANGIVVDEGTTDYTELENKPQINNVELSGNKTLEELGIQEALTPGTGIDITGGTISSTITTPDASTTVKGISRYATNEETIAHTVTTAAVTPSNLADLYTTKENTANKVTTITDDATDTQYPSAAAVNSRIMHIMNNSTDFVRTSGNQTIGDTKIFTGSFYKKVNLDITQNPEKNTYTNNKLITNNDDSAMSYTTLSLTTEGNLVNALYLRRIINEEYKYTGLVNTIDSEGNGFTCAVSAHDKNDTLYRADSIIIAGDLVNDTKDFNIVHKSGNEEIAGIKTFTDNITAPNQIDYTRITNCITKIPQDIKLELNNGTLTLKAGSKIYIPNGSGIFDEVITSTDMTLSYTKLTLTKELLLLRNNQTAIEHWTTTDCYSGNSQPLETYHCWYNTNENTIKSTTDGGSSYSTNLSLPIAIVSVDSTGILSIDQIFKGFGYIGSTVFTLPGIEGLCPNGRNEDGTLNNIKLTISKVYIRENATKYIAMGPGSAIGSANDFIIKDYYTEDFTGYLYNTSTNLMYAYDTIPEPVSRCILAELTFGDDNRITSLKPRTICNIPTFNDVVTRDEYLTETEIQRQIFNRIYDGRDLTKVFAKEIQHYSDEWAWIKARIQNADYSGLYVGDYIPVTISAGTVGGQSIAQQTFQCQIAGIDTYTNCGDVAIGHHIDFISREVIDTQITWNPEDNNNGTANEVNPWLSSQIYAWLNGVNNYTTSAYNNVPHGGDYSAGGILQLLPSKLTDKIITKRNLLDSRYDATKLLTYSTTWVWKDMGKLWLPNEIEVYGTQIRSNLGYSQGYWNPEANIAVAYPIYLGSGRNRIKRISSGGRSSWWLSSVVANDSSNCCYCHDRGTAHSDVATNAGLRAPLCFRVA